MESSGLSSPGLPGRVLSAATSFPRGPQPRHSGLCCHCHLASSLCLSPTQSWGAEGPPVWPHQDPPLHCVYKDRISSGAPVPAPGTQGSSIFWGATFSPEHGHHRRAFRSPCGSIRSVFKKKQIRGKDPTGSLPGKQWSHPVTSKAHLRGPPAAPPGTHPVTNSHSCTRRHSGSFQASVQGWGREFGSKTLRTRKGRVLQGVLSGGGTRRPVRHTRRHR